VVKKNIGPFRPRWPGPAARSRRTFGNPGRISTAAPSPTTNLCKITRTYFKTGLRLPIGSAVAVILAGGTAPEPAPPARWTGCLPGNGKWVHKCLKVLGRATEYWGDYGFNIRQGFDRCGSFFLSARGKENLWPEPRPGLRRSPGEGRNPSAY